MSPTPHGAGSRSATRLAPVPAHLVSQLERQLRLELDLQVKYGVALEEENSVIRRFRRDDIEARVETRAEIADRIEAAAQQREQLRQLIDPSKSMTITQIITERVSKVDKARLLKLALSLRAAIERNQVRGIELGRLVQFTQTLVDGSIAIFRSAAQPVTRSYGRNRVTVEREAPKTRGGMKITEA